MEIKPRVIGFMSLHYGKEYLKESLLSIRDYVGKMVISHSKKPSHGYATNLKCPETDIELYNIAYDVLGDKLIWDSSEIYGSESQHRNFKYKFSAGFDLILTIDADEVYKEDEIQNALNFAFTNPERHFGLNGYINFWRSFNFACYDGFRPMRIENLRNNNQLQNINCPLTVYHFSTCQREEIMRYKYKIFGHASEIKANYLENIFYKWTPENKIGDLHPVSQNLWNAVPFDKNTLPEYLKLHPNFNKDLV